MKNLGRPASWQKPLEELVARESSFNKSDHNPGSSAAGLFQFLDGTRKTYGGDNVNWNDPYNQSYYGIKYVIDRYGDPVKALQFWDARNAEGNAWY